MKKIKHIFFLLTVFLLSAFLLSCGKKEEASTPVTAEEASGLEGIITNYFQQIVSQSDEQLEESINNAYKERELVFHASLHDDYSGFSELSFNPVYSLSEKLFAAFQNMVVGMGTVFAVLIFIAWIISLFAHVHRWEVRQAEKKKERAIKSSATALVEPSSDVEKQAIPVLEKEEGISEEILSVILMAAVKAYEEDHAKKNPYSDARTLENGLFVRSIKRRK